MSDPLIGTMLGDYKILSLLGQGGMARVYRGHDEKLDRYAAVKVTDADFVVDELKDEYEARFTREARAIAHLTHPNIVGIYQFGQQEGRYFMAMHFIEGQDLRFVLREYAERGELLPVDQVVSIMRDTAAALDYAHRHGVIHRDIKPSNIMVTPEGTAILTDFGLALNVPEGTIGNTFGSAHYIAPEQAISSAQAVPQSDFYSLGIILFEIITGQVPFDDPSTMSVALKHLNEPPPLPSTINPHIGPAVEDVVMTMLRKTPVDRYPDGAAMIQALAGATLTALPESNLLTTADGDEEDTAELPAIVLPPVTSTQQVAKPRDAESIPSNELKGDSGTLIYSPLAGESVPAANDMSGDRGTPLVAKEPPVAARKKRGRGGRIALLLLLLLALIVGGGFIAMQAGLFDPASVLPVADDASPSSADPTAEATTVSMAATTDDVDTTEESPTDEPATDEPPTDEPATATEKPSDTPIPTETPEPAAPTTNAPTAAAVDSGAEDDAAAHLLLVYDAENVQFINQSDDYISVLPLEFRRTATNGQVIFLKARDFSGGTNEPDALSPGNCFQAWPSSVSTSARTMTIDETLCAERVGWRILSRDRLFWIDDEPEATFDVVAILARGEEVLTTCAVAAGQCAITLPYED
ncbi:protein kinase [Chloroflexota bacterium]